MKKKIFALLLAAMLLLVFAPTAMAAECSCCGCELDCYGNCISDCGCECCNDPPHCCEGCTFTPGYWKNHPEAWPTDPDDVFYGSGESWMTVLKTPPAGGNAYIILAHAYIAAYLNGENGACTDEVDAAMSSAVRFFESYEGNLTKAQRAELLSLADTLDQYNNGLIGPGHCE